MKGKNKIERGGNVIIIVCEYVCEIKIVIRKNYLNQLQEIYLYFSFNLIQIQKEDTWTISYLDDWFFNACNLYIIENCCK